MDGKIDVEEEQRLAASYNPSTTGPLVEELQLIQVLADEWEGASPVILEKLNDLVRPYPSWRRIRGDGSCGFRALLFGWFEAFITLHPGPSLQSQVEAITQKWASFGIDELFSDWIDSVTSLAARISQELEETGQESAFALLTEHFNDEDEQRELIQFLRTMTSAEMKANGDKYAGSLDVPVEQWVQENVDVPTAEMDFASLVGAFNAICQDADITVHVYYLDQSAGPKANVHTLAPERGEILGREICLLYRPGHYDLVYNETMNGPANTISVRGIARPLGEILKEREKATS